MFRTPLLPVSWAELKLAVLSAIKLIAPASTFPEESEPMFGQFLELFRRGLPPPKTWTPREAVPPETQDPDPVQVSYR